MTCERSAILMIIVATKRIISGLSSPSRDGCPTCCGRARSALRCAGLANSGRTAPPLTVPRHPTKPLRLELSSFSPRSYSDSMWSEARIRFRAALSRLDAALQIIIRRQVARLVGAPRRGIAQLSLTLRYFCRLFAPSYAVVTSYPRGSRAAHAASLTAQHGADMIVLLIIASMFAAFLIGVSPSEFEAVDRMAAAAWDRIGIAFTPARPQAPPALPDVLVVSPKDGDYISVAGTLSARGVRVLLAQDVASGAACLVDGQARFGMLVVDGNLAGRRRLVREARQRYPNIKVLVLEGVRQPTKIAAALMDYASPRAHSL